jgi:hypothetical protein
MYSFGLALLFVEEMLNETNLRKKKQQKTTRKHTTECD